MSSSFSNGALGVGFVLFFQMMVVAATQGLPVLAPFAASTFGLGADYVGYFTAVVFISALISSNGTSGLLARWGSFNGAAAALAMAGLGTAIVALSMSAWGLVLGALVLGIAYGPVNPAGSRLLMRVSAGHRQNLIFSIKQTSVAIGGAVAGAVLPAVAIAFGWRAALLVMALGCLLVAAMSIPTRVRLGNDANALASMRFKGPFGPAMLMLADPLLRSLSISVLSFSMAQFGLMSIYVTLLWSRMGLAPEAAAAMLVLLMAASVPGRLYWGWRADTGNSMAILSGLAASGVVVLAILLFMTPGWPILGIALLSAALGLGPLSWSGVLLAKIAQAGMARGGAEGILSTTAGTMVFAYFGGVIGPAMLSLSASLLGGYGAGLAIIAAALGWSSIVLSLNARPHMEPHEGRRP